MALPANTARVLKFLGHTVDDDFDVFSRDGVISLIWHGAATQPTEAEINDAANDLTLVNGQTFTQWDDEHGVDVTKTNRRLGAKALDALQHRDVLLRAALLVVMDEVNILRAQHSLAPRNAAQLRNAVKGKIAAGDADT